MEGPSLTVRVPATSANLGTGFDAVGLALTLTADVTLHLRDDGARARRPDPLRRMVLAALRAACRRAERPAPEGIQVEVTTEIPIARGLGASAVARAAGIVAANALLDGPLDDAALLALGAELEGHADNIAPALFGGLQVVAMDGHRVNRVPVALPPGLRCAAFVPDLAMPTRASRELLPKRLSRADAVHNSSRAALLVAALAAGRWDALETAVDGPLPPAGAERAVPADVRPLRGGPAGRCVRRLPVRRRFDRDGAHRWRAGRHGGAGDGRGGGGARNCRAAPPERT